MNKKNKLVLIDGNSYIHRAYHALPRLTDAEGELVNAVYGFAKMLKKIIKNENPSHIFVAFDHKEPTFRHKEYEEYKAHRKETDSELIEQFDKVMNVLKALNIEYTSVKGYEADDIIASLTKTFTDDDMNVTVVTGDKDALQLIDDNVRVVNGMKKTTYDTDTLKEELEIKPEQVVDYLALIGDKSDNLPGVYGIGPVTAKKLLKKFENLDNIYKNLDKLSKNNRKKLQKNRKEAFLTRRLVRLVRDIDLDVSVDDCLWQGANPEQVKKEFRKLNFRSLLKDWIEEDDLKGQLDIKVISSVEELNNFLDKNRDKKGLGLEVVTGCRESAVGYGLTFNGAEIIYIPAGHRYLGAGKQVEENSILKILGQFFKEAPVEITGYDMKKIYKLFKGNDIKINNRLFDIITANYILNAQRGNKTLKEITAGKMDWVPGELPAEPAEQKIEKISRIEGARLSAIHNLGSILKNKIDRIGCMDLFYDIEIKMVKILAEMELTGIKVNVDKLVETKKEFNRELKSLEKEIFDIAGEQFNINSSQQLSRILFNKIGLEPGRKTKTGYSTAEDVLEDLASEHELPSKVIKYRKLNKLITTYIEPLPDLVDEKDGRIHTSFNITGTATGRLSSSSPNLQNIPIKTKNGSLVREAFTAQEGQVLLSGDYSQIDLRVLAHISEDKSLIKSFNNNEDIHTQTASRIFEIDKKEVTREDRKKAKAINFGIVYGMSSWGLAKRVGISKNEARKFIDKYFEKYPGIKEYMDSIVKQAKEEGSVYTILNRRRKIPEINSSNYSRRKHFERIAINTPIQGSSADIIKAAMVSLDEDYDFNNGEVNLLLQIHDELLFSVPKNSVDRHREKIRKKMENAFSLKVPVKVEFKFGENWKDMRPC
ncbi:MAG: DNA polymerase I [Elusimicrobiota bacterium]